MKSRQAMRALAGILLCGLGLWLALPAPYRERIFVFDARGCRLETTIVEKQAGAAQGSVLLFHGISANKKIMSYFARGFAEQGLRVYVPDLPGHGRTPGRFSPARVEQCGEALLHELLARGMISADRTILAGHSMGGGIAERIAARVPVAGLIAISPAPMRAAHGSVLFSSAAMRSSQEWAARVLNLPPTVTLPSHRPLVGALAGFVGIMLIAGPFLREVFGKNRSEGNIVTGHVAGVARLLLEFAAGSVLSVLILRYWIPLKGIGLFQGDYLAGVSLLLGAMLIVMHWNGMRSALSSFRRHMLAAAFAGIVLFLLATAWFDLTFYAAWLTGAKCMRFPFLLIVFFPYLLAEETLLGPAQHGKRLRRLALALTLRLITWGAMMGGVIVLHDGEILIGLLALYLGVFNFIQRSGMDLVRTETASAAATALFGAILLAGFCLVIFPLT